VRSVRRLAIVAASAMATLVVSHELVYRFAHGRHAAEVMSIRGHDGYWQQFMVAVLALVVLIGGIAAVRLRQLSRLVARGTHDGASGTMERVTFLPALCRTWIGLIATTALLFVLQENAEPLVQGRALPGLTALVEAGGMPLGLIAAMSFLIGLVVTAVRWRHDTLVTRLAAVRPDWPRRISFERPVTRELMPAGLVAGPRSVRAPPAVWSLG